MTFLSTSGETNFLNYRKINRHKFRWKQENEVYSETVGRKEKCKIIDVERYSNLSKFK